MLTRKLLHVIAGRWDRAQVEPSCMYPGDRVHLVRRAWDEAGFSFGDDPRDLAVGVGLRVAPFAGRDCGRELATVGGIGYRWSADRRARGISVCHGIAHALLLREAWAHTHGDVWLVTLELLAPAHVCRRFDVTEVAREAHGPEAIIEAWYRVARQLMAWREAA